MSFQIKQGLAEFGYTDHYAMLGLPVDAAAADIRKRYVKIARILHPDSCAPSIDKGQASQVLSKLVNPAYQFLSQDKERSDYDMLLKLVGQRANLEFDSARLQHQTAKDLLTVDQYQALYLSTVQNLAENQYSQLNRVVNVIEQLSELNLMFLLRRELMQMPRSSQPAFFNAAPAVVTQPSSPDVSVTTPPKKPVDQATIPPSDEFIRQYIRRAEEYIGKNLHQPAIQELRSAQKLDPQNFRCSLLLGVIYLKLKQPKMAKGHLLKAQALEPRNAELLQEMNELKKQEAVVAKPVQSGVKAAAAQSAGKTKAAKPSGLFGWFGKKK
jgi:curved DNA-binding protein CbpA